MGDTESGITVKGRASTKKGKKTEGKTLDAKKKKKISLKAVSGRVREEWGISDGKRGGGFCLGRVSYRLGQERKKKEDEKPEIKISGLKTDSKHKIKRSRPRRKREN